jgi:hypothetical protein
MATHHFSGTSFWIKVLKSKAAPQTDLLVPAQDLDRNATVAGRAPSPPDWPVAESPDRAPTPESKDVYLCKALADRTDPIQSRTSHCYRNRAGYRSSGTPSIINLTSKFVRDRFDKLDGNFDLVQRLLSDILDQPSYPRLKKKRGASEMEQDNQTSGKIDYSSINRTSISPNYRLVASVLRYRV